MQIITEVRQRAQELVKENATTILTASGVVGTVATAVLAGRASYKAAEIIRDEELRHIHPEGVEDAIGEGSTFGLSRSEKIKLTWPLFLTPVVTGGATITAIIFSHRMNAQKAAALAAAYGMAQGHIEDYKAKVAEKLTPKKVQEIDDEVAQERVKKTPVNNVIIVGGGEVLCCDEPNGRYFKSTMDAIKKAENSTNAEILRHGFASATHFYEELGLPATSWTDYVGWNTDNMLGLKISTVMAPDEVTPCIAIDFMNLPKEDYVPSNY